MVLYRYQARDPFAKIVKGVIESADLTQAKNTLKEQNLIILELSEKRSWGFRSSLSSDEVMGFTLLLRQLVSSKIPLYESLLAIEEQYRGSTHHRVFIAIANKIKAGRPLSQALQEYPDSFDSLYCSLIRAGESAGALEKVLDKLFLFLSRKSKLQKEITTALIYPAILTFFAFTVIGVLLGFVIPSIEGIFAERKLNGFTEFIIHLSHFVRNYGLYLLIIAILASLFLYFQLKKLAVKSALQRLFMKLPIIGKNMIHASLSRFTRTLSTLLIGGLPLIQALELSRKLMQNAILEEEVQRAEIKIVEGSHLSQELSRSRWMPPLVSRMIAIGEETGKLAEVLEKIADIYEEEVEKNLKRLMALLQPILLVIMGLIIGLVLIAILLPLTDLSSL